MLSILRVRCRCTACGHCWRVPAGRIRRLERSFDVPKGRRIVWECHDCHEGLVVPGKYRNSNSETVDLDPLNLPKDILVLRF